MKRIWRRKSSGESLEGAGEAYEQGGNDYACSRMVEQIRINEGEISLQNGSGRAFYRKSNWEYGGGGAGHRLCPFPHWDNLRLRPAGGAGGHLAFPSDNPCRNLPSEDLRGAQPLGQSSPATRWWSWRTPRLSFRQSLPELTQ